MDYYVKELADQSAMLIAADGHVLEVFPSTAAAVAACESGCLVKPLFVQRHHALVLAAAVQPGLASTAYCLDLQTAQPIAPDGDIVWH